MANAWTLSSSDEEENVVLLPSSSSTKLFVNPSTAEQAKHEETDQDICPFGRKCYMKNPAHLKQFFHPPKKRPVESRKEFASQKKMLCYKPLPNLANKDLSKLWAAAAPNYFFFTTCNGIASEYNYSIKTAGGWSMGIRDILSEEFGVLKESAQFNYCIDIGWLMDQYPAIARDKPVLVVHGEQGSGNKRLLTEAEQFPNIKLCKVELPPYGTHHTKMMLLHYYGALRVIISTANLVPQDWDKKSQGFYMSPLFIIGDKRIIDNQSKFKCDLLQYLHAYKKKDLNKWIEIIEHANISLANNIRLVASVPGRHSGQSLSSWGHMKLRKVLSAEIKPIDHSWPIVGQFSSIGSLGLSDDKWLCSEWLTSLSASNQKKLCRSSSKKTPIKLIFPSVDDVRCSLEGYPAGASLPYSSTNAKKQKWLVSYFHRWRAEHIGRTHASPHIKTYMRISPYDTNVRVAWFLMTSANLSKAAWGVLEKKSTQLALRSYELGVLFLPVSQDQVPSNSQQVQDNYFHVDFTSKYKNKLCLPFSIPLTPYSMQDKPWIWDVAHDNKPDRHGNVWVPSI